MYHVGIDLGGTSIKAVAVTSVGTRLAHENIPFRDRDMEWADNAAKLMRDFRRRFGEPASTGVSAPGLAAHDGRSIAHMPGRLIGLEGLDWTRVLESQKPVAVLNDAHAALLGEAWIGAAKGLSDVFMLTLGTGVGGAAIVDGRLLRGHIGRAGHLGHVTVDFLGEGDCVGTPGSIELEIGNKSIVARSNGRFESTHTLVEAVQSGDADALRIWNRSIKALAATLASLINVLDPEAVIIGGGIARAGAWLFDPLAKELAHLEWRPMGSQVRMLPAELGELAGAYGSARNAFRQAGHSG